MNLFIYQTLLLLILAAPPTLAQRLTAGLKAGLNVPRLGIDGPLTDPIIDNRWRLAFHAGGFLRVPLRPGAALQTELLYSRKGCRFEQPQTNQVLALDYLSLPLLLNLNLLKGLVVEIGPELGFLLQAKRSVYQNPVDLGIDAGLRYALTEMVQLIGTLDLLNLQEYAAKKPTP